MAPVAIALCGKSPVHIEGLSGALAPKGYDSTFLPLSPLPHRLKPSS